MSQTVTKKEETWSPAAGMLKQRILSLFPVPFYTSSRIYFEGDLEEAGVTGVLDRLPPKEAEEILKAAEALSAVKPELALELIRSAVYGNPFPSGAGPERWVREALDIYDSQGLLPAVDFIRQGKSHPLFTRRWGKGVYLWDVAPVLEAYVNSLGSRSVSIKEGDFHFTDTTSIYLPPRVAFLEDAEGDALLYKIMVTCSYGRISLGTYRLDLRSLKEVICSLAERYARREDVHGISDLTRFFWLFPEPDLAKDLYALADAARIESWMADELPGLYRNLSEVKKRLLLSRRGLEDSSAMRRGAEAAYRWWLGDEGADCPDAVKEAVKGAAGGTAEDAARAAFRCYAVLDRLEGRYSSIEPLIHLGDLRPEEAERERLRRRESTRVEFRKELSKALGCLKEEKEIRIIIPPGRPGPTSGRKTLSGPSLKGEILVDGMAIPIPEALGRIIDEIYEDLGSIPSSYLAVTDEMSGHHFTHICDSPSGPANLLPETGEGVHSLDEWDYRRQGYRKNWTLLRETQVADGPSQGAEDILKAYGHTVRRIRRQFEFMRRDRVIAKRQKEGEDIDIDAAVEAIADLKAGAHPSEGLFMRLDRDKRDIAVVFLLDMSGSTSGWINRMERDMLLVLCEAISILRDRFAVYGFSGNTRLRCELYRIKSFGEPYDSRIKGRIMNIRAYEYTRLGAPIRYVTRLLASSEGRTKLLITLSDGKPDDYDGYRGTYGIEDTKQALKEALIKGIHPFCITIDKAEHSYIRQMYGEANYIFIDDISRLPLKIPEIYRRLTT